MKEHVRYSIRVELRKFFLETIAKGEGTMMTYEDLEKVMGCDPRKNRWLVHKAAEDVLSTGKVIDCKPKIGYFVAKANEVKGVVERDIESGARKTQKGFKKGAFANRSGLTEEECAALDHATFMAAIEVATHNKLKKIPQITEKTTVMIPNGKDLAEIVSKRKEL